MRAKLSVLVFGAYLAIVGLGVLFRPGLLDLIGLPLLDERLIRLTGWLAASVGLYYMYAAWQDLVPFYSATVVLRLATVVVFGCLLYYDLAYRQLFIFGAIDLAGALVTWWAIHADLKAPGSAAAASGA